MGTFCLFAYTGLTDRFRRARGFLYNLASPLKLIRSEKNNVLILENFYMMKNKSNFPNKRGKCSQQVNVKVKKNPKIPPADVIGGQFKV